MYTIVAHLIFVSFILADRDVQHNVSYSAISNCREGAIKYANVGEVNAIITLERNQFVNNCEKLYGNFSTCKSALWFDVQNTQSLYFRVSLMHNGIRNASNFLLLIFSGHDETLTPRNLIFQNNLVRRNQGGLSIRADSRGSATSLKGWIHNNLFAENFNKPAL